jgi:hypothetical protein
VTLRLLAILALASGCVASARSRTATPLPSRPVATAALPRARAPGPALALALSRWSRGGDEDAPAALLEIALSDDPAAPDLLLEGLATGHAAETASAMALAADGRALLLVALDHADPIVRRRAASGLRVRATRADVPALLAALRGEAALDADTCRLLLVAAARAGGSDNAAAVLEAARRAPADCGIGAAERAALAARMQAAGGAAAALRAGPSSLPDEPLAPPAAIADVATAARELVRAGRTRDAILRGAVVLARADDPEARAALRERLAELPVSSCRSLGAPLSPLAPVEDRAACDELGARWIGLGMLGDSERKSAGQGKSVKECVKDVC